MTFSNKQWTCTIIRTPFTFSAHNLYRHFLFKLSHQIFLVTFWRHLLTNLSCRWHHRVHWKINLMQSPISIVLCKANCQFSWPHCFFLPPLSTNICLLSLSLAFLFLCCTDHCPEGSTKGHSLEGSFTSACSTSPQLQHIPQFNPSWGCS